MVMPSPTQLQTPPTSTFGEFCYFIFLLLFFVGCFVYFLFRILLFSILGSFERKFVFHPLHRREHPALQCTFCTQHLRARVGGNQHTTGKRVGLAWCFASVVKIVMFSYALAWLGIGLGLAGLGLMFLFFFLSARSVFQWFRLVCGWFGIHLGSL